MLYSLTLNKVYNYFMISWKLILHGQSSKSPRNQISIISELYHASLSLEKCGRETDIN